MMERKTMVDEIKITQIELKKKSRRLSKLFIQKFFQSDSSPETVVWSCSVKKVFLEISQNSKENTCTGVSRLIKLQAQDLQRY